MAGISPIIISPVIGSRSLPSGGSSPTVLQPWYDSLSVKPSEGLWTDLKILADGMNEDGDWEEADLIGLVAGLETDEQRLRPFKSVTGLDFEVIGSPILNINGAQNTTEGDPNYIDIKYNPFVNGVKYTLNDAYISLYGDTNISGNIGGDMLQVYDDLSVGAGIYVTVTGSTNLRNASALNDFGITSPAIKTVVSGAKRYYGASFRISATQVRNYINGNYGALSNVNSIQIPNIPFYLLATNYDGSLFGVEQIARYCMFGSSSIDSDRVAARLNTFFSARGLPITNY